MLKAIRLSLVIITLLSVTSCANEPAFWDAHGALKEKKIWNSGGVKFNTPNRLWVNKKGKEILWKPASKSSRNADKKQKENIQNQKK